MSRLIEEWMKGTDEERRLRIAAYHEASHAVACYLLHKRFKYVTINPEEEKLGKITYPKKISRPIPSERELAVIKREYIVFLLARLQRVFFWESATLRIYFLF